MKALSRYAWLVVLSMFGISVVGPGSVGAQSQGERTVSLRVAYVAPVAVMAPLWLAADSGIFQREGLDVKVLYIEARSSMAALIAGEVDAIEISAPGVIPAVLSGANVTFISGLLNKMIFSFHTQKDIKSPEQLRGKLVGTDRPGTPTNYGGLVALSKMGLKAGDVQLLNIGGSIALWPALLSGQVAGVTLAPPFSFKADQAGFSRLVDTYERPYQNVGIVVRKDRIEPMLDTWVRFSRAIQSGIIRWYEDPKFAQHILTKYTKESDQEMLRKTYEFHTKQAGLNRDLTISEAGIQGILDFMGSTVRPEAKQATPKQFYDTRVLDLLKK